MKINIAKFIVVIFIFLLWFASYAITSVIITTIVNIIDKI